MARTIVDKHAKCGTEYVWLDEGKLSKVTIANGHYEWAVDLERGTCSLTNELPIGIDARRAKEIIIALQEIMPMLKVVDETEATSLYCTTANTVHK